MGKEGKLDGERKKTKVLNFNGNVWNSNPLQSGYCEELKSFTAVRSFTALSREREQRRGGLDETREK
jgi:hypothetical protein